MALLSQVYQRLADNYAGTLVADRIYQSQRDIIYESNGIPCIILNEISSVPSNTHQGPSLIDKVRVSVDIYGISHEQCNLIGEYVRSALDYSGTCGSPFNTDGILQWQSCVFDDQSDNPYIDQADNDGIHSKTLYFIFRTKMTM